MPVSANHQHEVGDAKGVTKADDLDRAETLHPRTKISHVSACQAKGSSRKIPIHADSYFNLV